MATDTQDRFEARLARLEGIVDQIDKRLDSLERQIAEVRAELRSMNGRMFWMWITTILAVLGAHYLK
jgi:phage shock protein A